MFRADELEAMLVRVGDTLPRELEIYLIGGCAVPGDFLHDVKNKKKHWP